MALTLFFDFDGTLIDSAPGILEGFRLVLAAENIEPRMPLETGIIGPPLPQTMAALTGETDAARLEHLTARFKAAYDTEGYKVTEPYADLHDTLETLHRAGHRIVLVTNKRRIPTELLLAWLKLEQVIDAIFTPDTWTPPVKSKIDTLRRAIEQLGTDPARAVMIGDSRDDAEAAAANGLACIAVTHGYGDAARQREFPVIARIDGLAELPVIVSQLE